MARHGPDRCLTSKPTGLWIRKGTWLLQRVAQTCIYRRMPGFSGAQWAFHTALARCAQWESVQTAYCGWGAAKALTTAQITDRTGIDLHCRSTVSTTLITMRDLDAW